MCTTQVRGVFYLLRKYIGRGHIEYQLTLGLGILGVLSLGASLASSAVPLIVLRALAGCGQFRLGVRYDSELIYGCM